MNAAAFRSAWLFWRFLHTVVHGEGGETETLVVGAAGVGEGTGNGLVIAPEVEVEPGGGAIQFPHTRRNELPGEFIAFPLTGQTLIGPDPNALLIRKDLAHTLGAATALPVPDMLGAL